MRKSNPLRDHVRAHAENRPGVYRMLGRDGEVLYVGKSIRIRNRLLSYFRADRSEKASELVVESERIAWEYVPNEFAALVREMKLIQRWQPRYNVQHRRRRRYAFVKITREAAPRVLPVTRVIEDGAIYYGPLPATDSVRQTVREVGQALQLRDCPAATPMHFSDQLDLWSPDRTPACLRADLNTCLAPCCGRTSEQRYRQRLAEARAFLDGSGQEPVRRVEDAMRAAARRMDFEYAALLRDRSDRMRRFQEELLAFRGRVESLSFVYRMPGFGGDDRVYLIRRGTIRDELPEPRTRQDRQTLERRIQSVFAGVDAGPAGLRANEAAEILLVSRWFRLRAEERARTVSPERATWAGGGDDGARPSTHGRRASRGGHETAPTKPAAGRRRAPIVSGQGTRTVIWSVTASTAGRE